MEIEGISFSTFTTDSKFLLHQGTLGLDIKSSHNKHNETRDCKLSSNF